MNIEIEVIEELRRVVTVEAPDTDTAVEIIKQQYHNEQVVLNSNDYTATKFTPVNNDTDSQHKNVAASLSSDEAQYLVSFINEELNRGEKITVETIEHALDAYEGGAR